MYVYVLSLLIECERPTLLRPNNLDGKQQHLGDEKRDLVGDGERREGKHLESIKSFLIFKMYIRCFTTLMCLFSISDFPSLLI